MIRPTGKTVLVVDDDPASRAAVSAVVERLGHAVVRAPDGVWALRTLDERAVDLVLLDLQMPRQDGFETLARLRAGRHRELPVVLLTAERRTEKLVRGYAEGADYYLTKPFKPEQLTRIVDYLIGDLSEAQRAKLAERL